MEKVLLPIKTKIAAWWMIIFLSIFSSFINLTASIELLNFIFPPPAGCLFFETSRLLIFVGGMILAIVSFFAIFRSGIFLLKRKKIAWKLSIGIISLYLIISVFVVIEILGSFIFFVIPVLYLIPLILLFLDRKNFWKIAS